MAPRCPPAPGDRRRARTPAKINLGLRIVGRRADGYHELESLFLPLDLCDEVAVEVVQPHAPRPRVTLDLCGRGGGVPAGGRNLAVRAALAFLEAAGLGAELAIRLEKSIPAAAGLGGGSSDAGAVLRLLAELWPGAFGSAELGALAVRVGADVPFFLTPRPSRVRGIGERVEPLAGVPSLPLLIACPRRGLSTAAVYRAFAASGRALTPPGAAPSIAPLTGLPCENGHLERGRGGGAADPAEWSALLRNDLEEAAAGLCPGIGGVRDALRAAGALAVGMSGSGPALFGIFGAHGEARRAGEGASFGAGVWSRATRSVASP